MRLRLLVILGVLCTSIPVHTSQVSFLINHFFEWLLCPYNAVDSYAYATLVRTKACEAYTCDGTKTSLGRVLFGKDFLPLYSEHRMIRPEVFYERTAGSFIGQYTYELYDCAKLSFRFQIPYSRIILCWSDDTTQAVNESLLSPFIACENTSCPGQNNCVYRADFLARMPHLCDNQGVEPLLNCADPQFPGQPFTIGNQDITNNPALAPAFRTPATFMYAPPGSYPNPPYSVGQVDANALPVMSADGTSLPVQGAARANFGTNYSAFCASKKAREQTWVRLTQTAPCENLTPPAGVIDQQVKQASRCAAQVLMPNQLWAGTETFSGWEDPSLGMILWLDSSPKLHHSAFWFLTYPLVRNAVPECFSFLDAQTHTLDTSLFFGISTSYDFTPRCNLGFLIFGGTSQQATQLIPSGTASVGTYNTGYTIPVTGSSAYIEFDLLGNFVLYEGPQCRAWWSPYYAYNQLRYHSMPLCPARPCPIRFENGMIVHPTLVSPPFVQTQQNLGFFAGITKGSIEFSAGYHHVIKGKFSPVYNTVTASISWTF